MSRTQWFKITPSITFVQVNVIILSALRLENIGSAWVTDHMQTDLVPYHNRIWQSAREEYWFIWQNFNFWSLNCYNLFLTCLYTIIWFDRSNTPPEFFCSSRTFSIHDHGKTTLFPRTLQYYSNQEYCRKDSRMQ